ncbi:MAG: hypothetical protein GWP91_06945 [Rhodobacterales bacterium]|nr:hypothetical protein [Rhodobacterales bacterium]
MTRVSFGLLLALVACQKAPTQPTVAGQAQAPIKTPATAVDVPMATSELLLWRVEKDGVSNHLFGTCHLPIPLDYALPPAQQPPLTDARLVVTELNMSQLDPMQIMAKLYDPSYSLSTQLGPEAWRSLLFRSRPALPATMLEHMPPWTALVILEMQDATPPPEKAPPKYAFLDAAIHGEAVESGADSAALETFEEQLAVMNIFNEQSLLQLQQKTRGEPSPQKEAEMDAIIQACLYSKSAPLEALLQDEAYAASMGDLLDVRNNNWMPKLEAMFADGGVFVAVGAAHMFGKSGLLTQLKANGYTLNRLSAERAVDPPWKPDPTADKPPFDEGGPVDEAAVERWSYVLTNMLTSAVCSDQNPMVSCLVETQELCTESVQKSVPLCVSQWADQLPQGEALISDVIQAQVAGCVSADLMISAISGPGISEAEACAPIRQAMEQAGL